MPTVTLIVPCYNEERTIPLLLDALYAQTYPRSEMEVVIADGMSTDRTRFVIDAFRDAHPDLTIRLIDNPSRNIPSALNQAIAAAQGEYVVRLDAHSAPYPDYVERCITALQGGAGDNVGGVWEILPGGESWIARGIAVAAAHPLGVGDAYYRYTGQARQVDTVPFGAYRRDLIDKVGGFDENLLTNEDYEFNARVRASGRKVWLDPGIRSRYYARPTLHTLARQYARYGFWKVRMLRRYPVTIRWRQALPPIFVLSILLLALLAPWQPFVATLLALEGSLYVLSLLVAGVLMALQNRDFPLIIGIPLAIATMHLSWGVAFLWGLITQTLFSSNRRETGK